MRRILMCAAALTVASICSMSSAEGDEDEPAGGSGLADSTPEAEAAPIVTDDADELTDAVSTDADGDEPDSADAEGDEEE